MSRKFEVEYPLDEIGIDLVECPGWPVFLVSGRAYLTVDLSADAEPYAVTAIKLLSERWNFDARAWEDQLVPVPPGSWLFEAIERALRQNYIDRIRSAVGAGAWRLEPGREREQIG